MSVVIKRSSKSKHIPAECVYGCCTTVYGKNVKKIRRSTKRSEKQEWRNIID